MTFVVLRSFECFAKYLNNFDCFDVKSMQSIVIWLLLLFCDVTQKFWSFRRQIDAMHYNLITFLVLRCFDRFDVKSIQIHRNNITFVVLRWFDLFDIKSMQFIVIWLLLLFCDVTSKFWSFRRQIDAMHYNLITFVVLRSFWMFFDVTQQFWLFCTSNRCNSL